MNTPLAVPARRPGVSLGLVTTGVQVLVGVLLPGALVFLLLLCNDRVVLGPWVILLAAFVAIIKVIQLISG